MGIPATAPVVVAEDSSGDASFGRWIIAPFPPPVKAAADAVVWEEVPLLLELDGLLVL